MNCGGTWTTPAKVNGGYCFYGNAGDYAWAYFGAWQSIAQPDSKKQAPPGSDVGRGSYFADDVVVSADLDGPLHLEGH